MRKLITVAMLLLSGCAASIPVSNEDLTYQTIIEVPSTPKDAIFEKSKQWIAQTFRSAKAVVEYDNREEGVIIGNGSMPRPISLVSTGGSSITYQMREDIKDGKARLTFDKWAALTPIGEMPILQADLEGVRANFSNMSLALQSYILGSKAADKW